MVGFQLLVLLRSQYLRALQRGEHRVLHAVVESDSLEVLVNLGSIDNVSRARTAMTNEE